MKVRKIFVISIAVVVISAIILAVFLATQTKSNFVEGIRFQKDSISSQKDSISSQKDMSTEEKSSVLASEGNVLSCVFFNMRKAPCNDIRFREAISYIVERDYISTTLLQNKVEPCYTFVPMSTSQWTQNEAKAVGFDSIKARELLNDSGYVYDSMKKTRVDSTTKQQLALTVLTPIKENNPILWDIGYTVTYYLKAMGIKAEHVALPDYLFIKQSMMLRDYDILIQDITLAPYPFGLFSLLHSSRDMNGTVAYSGVHNEQLDIELEKLWYGIQADDAQKASLKIQTLLAGQLPFIPVCKKTIFSYTDNKWEGYVPMPGVGVNNMWTYTQLKAVNNNNKVFGNNKEHIFTQAVPEEINTLNPLLAVNETEWTVLNLVVSPLLYFDPETLAEVPVLAKKWSTDKWSTKTGINGMKATFYLKPDVFWHDGVPFTVKDIAFCVKYLKSHEGTPDLGVIDTIEEVKILDDYTIEFYLSEPGYHYIYNLARLTFLPEHIWKDVDDYVGFKPWLKENSLDNKLTQLIGQGPFIYIKDAENDGVYLRRSDIFRR